MIRGIASDREKGLKWIYLTHKEKVCSYVLSNNGNVDEAKDIYQEALIAFYENVKSGRFKGDSTIGTYLYAIARFKWLNQLKRKGMVLEHQKHIEPVDSYAESPLVDIINKEKKDKVLSILGQLGESCKQLLVESIYHNTPMKDLVADGVYSSEQIARNKKYKCMKKLKALLTESPELVEILRSNA
ncbi:sigma-70 family RNA polymerase sigma factor [Winogradskyella sp.]|uniref:RNA polymerase sigma factor n=1 Tax=Winogradskyella sp. TaxID=1883156 RepID=UPI0025DB8C80|nr:sigma-70 family RNA polymerase sigma factor [Winogradskyella sp.]